MASAFLSDHYLWPMNSAIQIAAPVGHSVASDPEKNFKPGHLRSFEPFARMQAEQIIVAATRLSFERFAACEIVLAAGSQNRHDYYLLRGQIELREPGGGIKTLVAGSTAANQPLPQIRPSLYEIVALDEATVFKIPHKDLALLRAEAPVLDVQVDDDMSLDVTQTRQFMHDFQKELEAKRVVLPSLPEVALKVREEMRLNRADFKALARTIQQDPALSAKLLKIANSPLFRGRNEIIDCADAIARLGLRLTDELVICFGLKDLFTTKSEPLRERLIETWRCAVQVSGLCVALARRTPGLVVERAMLSGLLHNIGVLPIFSHAAHNPVYLLKPELVDKAVARMQNQVSAMILDEWRLGEDLKTAVVAIGQWSRDTVVVDYGDLISVALRHYFLAEKVKRVLPPMSEIPAFSKIAGGDFTPELSMEIIAEAQGEIADTLKVLS